MAPQPASENAALAWVNKYSKTLGVVGATGAALAGGALATSHFLGKAESNYTNLQSDIAGIKTDLTTAVRAAIAHGDKRIEDAIARGDATRQQMDARIADAISRGDALHQQANVRIEDVIKRLEKAGR